MVSRRCGSCIGLVECFLFMYTPLLQKQHLIEIINSNHPKAIP